jgi:hypothetical protein
VMMVTTRCCQVRLRYSCSMTQEWSRLDAGMSGTWFAYQGRIRVASRTWVTPPLR